MFNEPIEIEPTEFPTVLAFDPGVTTGWCIMTVHSSALTDDDVSIIENVLYWSQGQVEGDDNEQSEFIADMLEVWDSAALLFEDFKLRTMAADLTPLRITTVATFIAQSAFSPPRSVFLQMPSMAKTTITDDRLKRWGMYKRGEEHARDAERHALCFLRRAKNDPRLRNMAWPYLYGTQPVS